MTIGDSVQDVLNFIDENDIKFLRMQFCEINGISRNVAISDTRVEDAFKYGVSFDGNYIDGFGGDEQSDLILRPDFSTIAVLPWRPQRGKVASVLCNVTYPDGSPCYLDSRQILLRQVAEAQKKGYSLYVGADCEFYLFKQDEDGRPTFEPGDEADYCSFAPRDRSENTRRDICLTLENMGFKVESSHHEKGPGQNQINFRDSETLKAADQLMTLRNVVRNIAHRNGLHATFMPKPQNGRPGSGMHVKLSLFRDGRDLFVEDENGISPEAGWFIAGLLKHIPAITAFANPTINSYKRLAAESGVSKHICWGIGTRKALLRIPRSAGSSRKLELRSPDPSCNPYLTYALILAAGLDGIENKLELPKPITTKASGPLLPESLHEALHAMNEDPLVEAVLGKQMTEKFMDIKLAEWQQYSETVHDWEQKNYFDIY